MPDPNPLPPARRADLILGPPAADGHRVVKDPLTGGFYQLGCEEAFLLEQLDGRRGAAEVCAAFEKQFGGPLSEEDLGGFVEMARAQQLLQPQGTAPVPAPAASPGAAQPAPPATPPAAARPARMSLESLLYWRVNFFDPDRLFNCVEPKIRFFWTRGFAVMSLAGILAALVVLTAGWRELVGYLPSALRWETLVLAWLILVGATFLHEFAHGLTCKHYGGEVHEVGFLMMFGMPCFYCNVSDAWLMPQKSRRLLVTLAGGYCDLCVWALAVYVWRFTATDSRLNYLAYVLLSVCGSRVFFNFNPFLKLDGYYLLSDWLEVPNLRQRAQDRVMARLRRLLWGGARPDAEPRGRLLLAYGLVSWLMSLCYLGLMVLALFHVFGSAAGLAGRVAAVALGLYLARGLFAGFTAGEFLNMLRKRLVRTAAWLLILAGVTAALFFVEIEDRRAGPFQVRPALRLELRARVSGFLSQVPFDEGDQVSGSIPVAVLEIPDLDSKITGKKAEVREVKAKLRLLEAGPRPEELREQRLKVQRAVGWRDQGAQSLARDRSALKAELVRLDKLLTQNQSELEYARYAFQRDQRLYAQDILPMEQYRDKKKNLEVRESMLAQARAERQAREAKGVLEAETELARREKELADTRSALTLLEAGTRPEEIEAERARAARLQEELAHLEAQRDRLAVTSPVAGMIVTPRLKEKVGQYLKEGDPICTVDSVHQLEIELYLDEQEVARIHPGARVELKARAFPFRTFHGEIARVAPAARKDLPGADPSKPAPPPRPDAPGLVTVYCTLEDAADLRPGMSGSGRVLCGRRPIGAILLERAVRLVRTDYWW